jgi:hypothetical protein
MAGKFTIGRLGGVEAEARYLATEQALAGRKSMVETRRRRLVVADLRLQLILGGSRSGRTD